MKYMPLTATAFALSSGMFVVSVVAASDSAAQNKQPSADCAKFLKQADADVGDIIRAGCKPTLAQMSALMDNPVGNVAMWWNQVDYYSIGLFSGRCALS